MWVSLPYCTALTSPAHDGRYPTILKLLGADRAEAAGAFPAGTAARPADSSITTRAILAIRAQRPVNLAIGMPGEYFPRAMILAPFRLTRRGNRRETRPWCRIRPCCTVTGRSRGVGGRRNGGGPESRS